VPVRLSFAQAGRVVPGELPACGVARTVYRGPYEGLGEAWREFDAWIAANGYQAAPGLWEFYLTGPNAAEPQTELNRPLIG
jgi:effector-binding domain-containing protein